MMTGLFLDAQTQRTRAEGALQAAKEQTELAQANEKAAASNALEAVRQRDRADLDDVEKQAEIAQWNAIEAQRQRDIAKQALDEAKEQVEIAQRNAEEAQRQRDQATREQLRAEQQTKIAQQQTEVATLREKCEGRSRHVSGMRGVGSDGTSAALRGRVKGKGAIAKQFPWRAIAIASRFF
ncbi:MAG TPA: hypothetical protein V6C88_15630 [Chroococcidiopsis sp.]